MIDKSFFNNLITCITVFLALLMSSALPLMLSRCKTSEDLTVPPSAEGVFISYTDLSRVIEEKLLSEKMNDTAAYIRGVYTDKMGRCVFVDIMGKKIQGRAFARAISLPCDDFFIEMAEDGVIIIPCR